jgi:MFS family permease
MMAADIPAGLALKRFGPVPLVLASLGLTVLGSLAGALTASLLILIASRAITGLGYSMIMTLGIDKMGQQAAQSAGALQLAALDASTMLARSTAPMASGFAATLFGWRASFVLASGVGMAIVALALILLGRDKRLREAAPARHTKQAPETHSAARSRLGRQMPLLLKTCLLAYLYFALIFARVGSTTFLFPLLGRDILFIRIDYLGLLLGGSLLLTMFLTLFGAALTRSAGQKPVLLIGILCTLTGMLLVSQSPTAARFVASLLILPLGGSCVSLTWNLFHQVLKEWGRKDVIGFLRLAGDSGAAFAPIALGQIASHGITLGFAAIAALLLPALGIASLWPRPPEKSKPSLVPT